MISRKDGNKYKAVVKPLPDSYPNICDIEITATPYDNASWKKIGKLIQGRKSEMVCVIDRIILKQDSNQANLIVVGLKMLGLIAQSAVRPAIRSDYDGTITDYRLPEIQALLGVTLEYDANNPTITYKVRKFAYARKDLYTLEVRLGI